MTAQPWAQARTTAWSAAAPLPSVTRPLPDCIDHILSKPVVARTDLPAFDTAAMDGWAVAGRGPWKVFGEVLAGERGEQLAEGEATEVATGAEVPPGATGVLRSECGSLDGFVLSGQVTSGRDLRLRGEECTAGDVLLPAGARVTPAVLGLAAAAGYDELPVVARPSVDVLVMGDELLQHGLPRDGRIRDALSPLLPGWLDRAGAGGCGIRSVPDRLDELQCAVEASVADVLVTTGGTAHGPHDHLRSLLARIGAELLVDGVQVRPGHPMLLARLSDSRLLVGLPGNPLAAVAGIVTLIVPVLGALRGETSLHNRRIRLVAAVPGHPVDARIVPLRDGVRLPFAGPAMLRGIAGADALAVIPPGGAAAGADVEILACD